MWLPGTRNWRHQRRLYKEGRMDWRSGRRRPRYRNWRLLRRLWRLMPRLCSPLIIGTGRRMRRISVMIRHSSRLRRFILRRRWSLLSSTRPAMPLLSTVLVADPASPVAICSRVRVTSTRLTRRSRFSCPAQVPRNGSFSPNWCTRGRIRGTRNSRLPRAQTWFLGCKRKVRNPCSPAKRITPIPTKCSTKWYKKSIKNNKYSLPPPNL